MKIQIRDVILFGATALSVSACASVVHDARRQAPASGSTMSASSATAKIRASLNRAIDLYAKPLQIKTIKADREAFTLTLVDPSDGRQLKSCELRFGTDEPIQVWEVGGGYAVRQFFNGCGQIHWRTHEDAITFADALVRLDALSRSGNIETTEQSLESFKKIAADYRARKSSFALSEEAHKYQVLAENAFDEKRYGDAIDYYSRALELAPWWPSGHYNRAMLLAKQNNFEDAIDEMKRYLELEPNAADSRTARDKMYIWEGKVEKASTSSGAAPAPTY